MCDYNVNMQMARLQLAKQELQDRCREEFNNDTLLREVNYLKKELAAVQEKINENMEIVCYQVADLMMWFIDIIIGAIGRMCLIISILCFHLHWHAILIQLTSFWICYMFKFKSIHFKVLGYKLGSVSFSYFNWVQLMLVKPYYFFVLML